MFFLEPLLEPATERQAGGRVHRMGQLHPTFVHRLWVRGTVEEAVVAIARHREGGVDEGGGRVYSAPSQQQQQQQQIAARTTTAAMSVVAGVPDKSFSRQKSETAFLIDLAANQMHLVGATNARRDAAAGDSASSVEEECEGTEVASQGTHALSAPVAAAQPYAARMGHAPVTRGDVLAMYEAGERFIRQLRTRYD